MLKRLFIIFLLSHTCAQAQELLTLDMAVQKALESNFDIRVARTAADQAEANNTVGNAGMVPNITASGGASAGSQNVRIDFIDGRTQRVSNAALINYNGSVNLNWTLFDGGKMFLKKKQLGVLEEVSKAQLKEQVQSIVSQLIQAYAQVVLQQQQGIAIDTGLLLARTRMELSQLKYETGGAAKTDYLQARVDYNSRRSDSLQQQALLITAFATLNALMGEDAETQYRVQNELELDKEMLPEHKELLEQLNPTLSIARFNAQSSLLDAKIAKTAFLPTLALNGGYNFNNTRSQSGFTNFNQSYGPNGGLTLNFPIFKGGNIRREARIASLQAMRYDLLYDKQVIELGRQYRTAWYNYKVAVNAYDLEEENLVFAEENLYIQKERFRVGVANTLETRQAENSFVQALVRYYTAAYNLKVNETKVLQLEGGLVK